MYVPLSSAVGGATEVAMTLVEQKVSQSLKFSFCVVDTHSV